MQTPAANHLDAGSTRRRLHVQPKPQVALALDAPNTAGRHRLEACIARKFDLHYNAQLKEFLPQLLSLEVEGELSAVLGLRPARDTALFLENYLDGPVEQAISRAYRTPVYRSEVIEIGNLAAAVPGATYGLFAVLASILHAAGFRWVVCTATLQVEALLASMEFPSRPICTADPRCLGDKARHWGRYYAAQPQVIAGNVQDANERTQSSKAMLQFTHQLSGPIADIATRLQEVSH